jgi:hypothetical protein
MSKFLTPCQVVKALMQGISDSAWIELHAMFSDDAVIEYPFALPSPTRSALAMYSESGEGKGEQSLNSDLFSKVA